MIITLSLSASFFNDERLTRIVRNLEAENYTLLLPKIKETSGKSLADKTAPDFFRDHFEKIDRSDALYVANFDKKGIEGHIGGSCLIEMGKAYHKRIPIFLYQDLPLSSPYRDELVALKPILVGLNFQKINDILRPRKN